MGVWYPPQGENDILLIVGTAPCRIEDLDKAEEQFEKHDVLCLGLAGREIKCRYWFSVHPELLVDIPEWKPIRIATNPDKHYGTTLVYVPRSWKGGSSALDAVYIGLSMGYSLIVLCGCPLDTSGNEIRGSVPKIPDDYTRFLKRWKDRKNEMQGKVISMSGNTKKVLEDV